MHSLGEKHHWNGPKEPLNINLSISIHPGSSLSLVLRIFRIVELLSHAYDMDCWIIGLWIIMDYLISRNKTTTLMNYLGGLVLHGCRELSGSSGPLISWGDSLEKCHPGTKRLPSPFEFRCFPCSLLTYGLCLDQLSSESSAWAWQADVAECRWNGSCHRVISLFLKDLVSIFSFP